MVADALSRNIPVGAVTGTTATANTTLKDMWSVRAERTSPVEEDLRANIGR